MKYTVKNPVVDSERVEFYLVQAANEERVTICAERSDGTWYFIGEISKDGFYAHMCVPDTLGIATDDAGRIRYRKMGDRYE